MKLTTAKAGVVALCIDGPNMEQLRRWMDQGRLPALGRIAEQGLTATYRHTKRYRNERCWDLLVSGRDSGSAGSVFCPETYDYYNLSLQREAHYEPFYALGDDYRVCVFDLQAPPSGNVNGIQVSGWGGEQNACRAYSSPPHLLGELIERYGPDPKLQRALNVRDYTSGEQELSWVVPDIYDRGEVERFRDNLITSVERRTAICEDLLAREDWDLFLGIYPESHSANHLLWHMGEPYPVDIGETDEHGVLQVMQAIDRGIERLERRAGPGTRFVVYTLDNTAANTMDVPAMALLPEYVYRWNFPGRRAISAAGSQALPEKHWKHRVWSAVTVEGRKLLESPGEQERRGDPMSWNPANWYRALWPAMRAFALPSVADGYIRLNVEGRERRGVVPPAEYQDLLDELSKRLTQVVNPATGKALVKEVIQIRRHPEERSEIPPDLVVVWEDLPPACALDSPDLGRIGPLPYFRSGGHVAHGADIENLLVARGPVFEPGSTAGPGHLLDVPATILDLMDAPRPFGMPGRSLVPARRSRAAV